MGTKAITMSNYAPLTDYLFNVAADCDEIEMTYRTPEDNLLMIFEIRHITQLEKGAFKGHHQVGLSL